MDRLLAMKVFTRVVETNSFTRAADTLDMPRASVSVIVQQLEAHLKVRLLQRTTRRINLTVDGAAYYERCIRILEEIEETESSFANAGQQPRGRLRVEMQGALGKQIVMPHIAEFHARYPEIELMAGFGDRPVDLIQEGVDCAIRVGMLQDSSLVARRVGTYQAVTVASPAYLRKYGEPAAIADLERHVAVNYFWPRSGRMMEFTFATGGDPVAVKMNGNIAVNDAQAYLESALEGVGLVQAARFMALPYLKSGRLVEVLSQWKPLPMPISVVYPHSRHLAPTVRAFVDWIAELFERSPLFSADAPQPLPAGTAAKRERAPVAAAAEEEAALVV
ncbi:LysR family transcriptional regulator [Cupriavidus sp. 30B13]|uniref:LysR family transcriptional regulator n=1 Tax=Cupriavidus sp. 30B13 TaxID=3384241 RepID=UPI003B9017C4